METQHQFKSATMEICIDDEIRKICEHAGNNAAMYRGWSHDLSDCSCSRLSPSSTDPHMHTPKSSPPSTLHRGTACFSSLPSSTSSISTTGVSPQVFSSRSPSSGLFQISIFAMLAPSLAASRALADSTMLLRSGCSYATARVCISVSS